MNLSLFLPELALCGVIVFYLCLTLAKNVPSVSAMTKMAGVASLVVLAASLASLNATGELFAGTYRVDLLSQSFKALVALGFVFTAFVSGEPVALPGVRIVEYHLFLASAALGMVLIPSSVNLVTLYVSLELSAYSLYLLTALKQDRRNAEAGVKYLILGAAASGVFLWGASLVMGLAQSALFADIAARSAALSSEPAFLLGIVFILFSFLFKLSAFPVHFWAPDVYEAAPTPVTAFIATSSKAAAVAVLVRFMATNGISAGLVSILGVFAFASMTLGNTVALVQKDVKRILAYSSVAQAGYILVGLMAGTPDAYACSLFYALAYLLMNAGAFLVVILVSKAAKRDNPQLSDFDGLAERSPKLALLLLLSLLSLAGIPPLVGFTGKWVLFTAAMQEGHWFLVLWAVLNSVVSLFYYLSIVRHAYLEKPAAGAAALELSAGMKLLGLALLLAIVLLGVFPAPLLTIAQHALGA